MTQTHAHSLQTPSMAHEHSVSELEWLLHCMLLEERMHRRLRLANKFRKHLKNQTTPMIDGKKVLFLYEGASQHVSIVGDWTQWRHHVRLKRVPSTSIFYVALEFPETARLQYKMVVDGAWQLDPKNPRTASEGFGTNSEFMMPQYKDESWTVPLHIEGKPLHHGKILTLTLQSTHLNAERELRLYLPYLYDNHAKTKTRTQFPLLVLHDGAEAMSLGGYHQIVDNLIHAEQIPPCVVLFIPPHLPKRNDEYTLNPAYIKYCLEEVLPLGIQTAQKHGYHIADEPVYRCVSGASLGGLLATYMAFHHPDIWGAFYAQSPSYWWQQGVIFQAENMTNVQRVKAVLQTGTISDAHALTVRMKYELEQRGTRVAYHEYQQGHTWGNWRSNFAKGVMEWAGMLPVLPLLPEILPDSAPTLDTKHDALPGTASKTRLPPTTKTT